MYFPFTGCVKEGKIFVLSVGVYIDARISILLLLFLVYLVDLLKKKGNKTVPM